MIKKSTKIIKEYQFFPLFQKFISESQKGSRLQPNSKRISKGTIKNYCSTSKLLEKFCNEKGFSLRIREERRLNSREMVVEKSYWKKFYKKFTDYFYH